MARQSTDFTLQGVQIRLRNFEGKAGMYNAEGQRNFVVILPEDENAINALLDAGIPVKEFKLQDDDEPGTIPTKFIKVKVNIDNDPMPRFVLVTDRGKTTMHANQETMVVLDWSDIIEADLILNPYAWDYQGKTGVNVYLKAGYFRIREDDLQAKYADTPDTDSAQKSTINNSVSFTPNDPDEY